MRGLASALGLGHLGLLLGTSLLFAGIATTLGNMYLAQQASNTGAVSIVQAALNIVYHIGFTTSNPSESGSVFTYYNAHDGLASPYPNFDQQKLLQYWQSGSVSVNDVQCAGFVAAVLDQANEPMVQPLGYAIDYWLHPGNSFPASEWQYVRPMQGGMAPASGITPTTGAPQPGDVAVFTNTGAGINANPGHVAIVIAVNPPTSGQNNGTLVLAQANFPPNYYTLDPGKSTWKGTNPVSWITTRDIPLYVVPYTAGGNMNLPGQTLLGYIRNLKAQVSSTGVDVKVNLPKSQWVQVAEQDAAAQNPPIPGTLLAKQIEQESGFNPNALSSTGAEGIAQFEPGTAAGYRDPFDSSKPFNPYDPAQALEIAARAMSASYKSHLTPGTSSTVAYEEALADYNCGACIKKLEDAYGNAWIAHFPTFAGGQTWNYIKVIAPWQEFPGCGLAPQLSTPGLACLPVGAIV
jgi:hypothetical protein